MHDIAEYDVVIVGAGTAGCVLAERLSARADHRVLLLEAGPDGTPPGLQSLNSFAARGEPGRMWNDLLAINTAHRPPVPYRRGRGVGGSGAVNAMLALPGDRADYDGWERAGATGWGYDEVAPVLRSLMRATTTVAPQPLDRALLGVAPSMGWGTGAIDHRVGGRSGLGPAPLTVIDGRRHSTADSHLALARSRPNLEIRADCLVDTVCLSRPAGSGRATALATGVVLSDGSEISARHVVLAAGAIHTPTILLRSRVEREGIGSNLSDHCGIRVTLELNPDVRLGPDDPPIASVARFSSGRSDELDLQLLPMGSVGPTPTERHYGLLMMALMRPRSRGSLRLASADPNVHPLIDLGLLSDDFDTERLLHGLHLLSRVAASPEIAATATNIFVDDRGTKLEELLTGAGDKTLVEWMKRTTGDYVHICGTCRMGSTDDPDAVVDPKGAVIGVNRLWVADASVMPSVPSVNTHIPTAMIACRIADRISPELVSS